MPKKATTQSPAPKATTQSPAEALEITDRSLRRLLRRLREANPSPPEDLEKEMKRAQRQLRANRELLGTEDSNGEAESTND